MPEQAKRAGLHQLMIGRDLHIDGKETTEDDDGPPTQSQTGHEERDRGDVKNVGSRKPCHRGVPGHEQGNGDVEQNNQPQLPQGTAILSHAFTAGSARER